VSTPLASWPFGEADLQCLYAAFAASKKGKPVIVATIDTDYHFMLAASQFTPVHPFVLDLPSGRVCGRLLAAKFGGASAAARLNAAFWMLTLGCDYSDPFSRLGIWNRSLIERIMQSADNTNANVFRQVIQLKEGGWTFDHNHALRQLSHMMTRKKTSMLSKRTPAKAVQEALFCLRYYSFSFEFGVLPYPSPNRGPKAVYPLFT
jgi:hypothetical protein